MFGLASSAGVFGSVADMLINIYSASGFGPLVKWVDNFFAICLPEHSWTENNFLELTSTLGIPWSIEKLRPLAVCQRYCTVPTNSSCKVTRDGLEELEKSSKSAGTCDSLQISSLQESPCNYLVTKAVIVMN